MKKNSQRKIQNKHQENKEERKKIRMGVLTWIYCPFGVFRPAHPNSTVNKGIYLPNERENKRINEREKVSEKKTETERVHKEKRHVYQTSSSRRQLPTINVRHDVQIWTFWPVLLAPLFDDTVKTIAK